MDYIELVMVPSMLTWRVRTETKKPNRNQTEFGLVFFETFKKHLAKNIIFFRKGNIKPGFGRDEPTLKSHNCHITTLCIFLLLSN